MTDEPLPASLAHFGAELERAIARPSVRRRTGPAVRLSAIVVAAAAVAAAVVVIVAPFSTDTQSAWAQRVLARAAAAIAPASSYTILHLKVTQTLTPRARRDTVNTPGLAHRGGVAAAGQAVA